MTLDETLEVSYYLTSKGYKYINNVNGISIYFHPDGMFINVHPDGNILVYTLADESVQALEVTEIRRYINVNNLAEMIYKGL